MAGVAQLSPEPVVTFQSTNGTPFTLTTTLEAGMRREPFATASFFSGVSGTCPWPTSGTAGTAGAKLDVPVVPGLPVIDLGPGRADTTPTVTIATAGNQVRMWPTAIAACPDQPLSWLPVRVLRRVAVVAFVGVLRPKVGAPWTHAVVDFGRWHSLLPGAAADTPIRLEAAGPEAGGAGGAPPVGINVHQFTVDATARDEALVTALGLPPQLTVLLGCALGQGNRSRVAIRRGQWLGVWSQEV